MAGDVVGGQRFLEPEDIEGSNSMRLRRIASAAVNDWLASTMMSSSSPTAPRTAASRSSVLDGCAACRS